MLFKQQAARWVSTCWVINHQPTAVLCSSRAENTAPNGKIHVLAELRKTPLASTTGRVEIGFFWIKKFSIQSWTIQNGLDWFVFLGINRWKQSESSPLRDSPLLLSFVALPHEKNEVTACWSWSTGEGREHQSSLCPPWSRETGCGRRGGITSTPGLAGFSLKLTKQGVTPPKKSWGCPGWWRWLACGWWRWRFEASPGEHSSCHLPQDWSGNGEEWDIKTIQLIQTAKYHTNVKTSLHFETIVDKENKSERCVTSSEL